MSVGAKSQGKSGSSSHQSFLASPSLSKCSSQNQHLTNHILLRLFAKILKKNNLFAEGRPDLLGGRAGASSPRLASSTGELAIMMMMARIAPLLLPPPPPPPPPPCSHRHCDVQGSAGGENLAGLATRSHHLGSNKSEASTSGGFFVTIVILVKVMIMMLTAIISLWPL